MPLPPAAYYPGSRAYVHEESLAAARAEVAAGEKAIDPARQALAAARQKLTEFVAANPPKPATPAPAPAAPAPAPAPPSAPAPSATPAAPPVVTLADDFSKPNPELWTAGKGKFEHQGGHVVQQESLDAQCGLTSQKPHPRDFQAKFRFKITGGKMWRSLGLSFDAHGDSESNFVYVSAFADGRKIQLAHRRNGQDEYPADLAKPLPIELNRVYELTVSVRDHLVNVALDGQARLDFSVCRSRRYPPCREDRKHVPGSDEP